MFDYKVYMMSVIFTEVVVWGINLNLRETLNVIVFTLLYNLGIRFNKLNKSINTHVTPECFYRESITEYYWIPSKSMRE